MYSDGSVSQQGVPKSFPQATDHPEDIWAERAATSVGMSSQKSLLISWKEDVIAVMRPSSVGRAPLKKLL